MTLYELLLYQINEYDGGFYLVKASLDSHDPCEPNDFNKQNVGIYRLQVHGPDLLLLMSVPSHDIGRQIAVLLWCFRNKDTRSIKMGEDDGHS
ncbi:UbiD family decarboxylase domain-containing protein [Alteribacillus sp. HJP-4]|uniref:UbiD family decarboxylase domain-containing protein n=1 Tax=Alteribacillus sp. HJP-4 TaxID=2775394 RepID=UPI0035CD1278